MTLKKLNAARRQAQALADKNNLLYVVLENGQVLSGLTYNLNLLLAAQFNTAPRLPEVWENVKPQIDPVISKELQ